MGIMKLEVYDDDGPALDLMPPLIFPNILRIREHDTEALHFRVPIDDTHTRIIWIGFDPTPDGSIAPAEENPPVKHIATKDDQGEFLLTTFYSQDAMAWETQGAIADRSAEHLGATDRGVTLFRQMLREQIDIVERGGDPLGLVWDASQNECIAFSDELEWQRWEQCARKKNRRDILEDLNRGRSFRKGYSARPPVLGAAQ